MTVERVAHVGRNKPCAVPASTWNKFDAAGTAHGLFQPTSFPPDTDDKTHHHRYFKKCSKKA